MLWLCVVTSECSRNYFISEKYTTLESFKLHFPQNGPLVQVFICSSDWKCVVNIPGSRFMKTFSALRCILKDVSSITKRRPFNAGFYRGNR